MLGIMGVVMRLSLDSLLFFGLVLLLLLALLDNYSLTVRYNELVAEHNEKVFFCYAGVDSQRFSLTAMNYSLNISMFGIA